MSNHGALTPSRAEAPRQIGSRSGSRISTDACEDTIGSSPQLFVANECERCRSQEAQIENLRAELERMREAAAIDIQNLQTDVLSKQRKVTRLENELKDKNAEEPEHDEVTTLLLHWRAVCGKTKRAYIGADDRRYKIAKTALKRHGFEGCKTALEGLGKHRYAGPRGRSAEQYPGSTRYDDVEHALGDAKRYSECFKLATGRSPDDIDAPTLITPPSAKAPMPKPVQLHREGIDEFLNGLTVLGKAWRPSGPEQWMAQCPAHADRTPSLHITRKPTRRVLLHCFAGCPDDEIQEIVGVPWSVLLGDEARNA